MSSSTPPSAPLTNTCMTVTFGPRDQYSMCVPSYNTVRSEQPRVIPQSAPGVYEEEKVTEPEMELPRTHLAPASDLHKK
jgi:hypothetical protein